MVTFVLWQVLVVWFLLVSIINGSMAGGRRATRLNKIWPVLVTCRQQVTQQSICRPVALVLGSISEGGDLNDGKEDRTVTGGAMPGKY